MAKLSSNWKKLSTKIDKSNTKKGSIQKPTSKKPSSKSTAQKVHRIGHIVASKNSQPQSTTEQRIKDQKVLASPLEYSLWTQSDPINPQNIPKLPKHLPTSSPNPSAYDLRKSEPGRYISIDCEFVGIGPEGEESTLARISIVNYFGVILFDSYVRPREKVTDFRTWVSGIKPFHLRDAMDLKQVQEKTANILQGKVLVGHAVKNDLDMLYLSHPMSMIRDTSKFKKFRQVAGGKSPSLKKLTKEFLGLEIQTGEHSSVEDARATMLLFRMFRKQIEAGNKK